MSSQNQATPLESNLVFFLHDRFEPSLRRTHETTSSQKLSTLYNSLDLIESFLWLHLGVEVGYFPQPLSRRVLYEYSVPIFKAYDVVLESHGIETWFAPPMRNILSEEFSGTAPLINLPQPASVTHFLDLWLIFQNALVTANRLAQNGQTAGLVAAMSLVSDFAWQKILSRVEPGSPGIQIAEEEGLTWSLAGFFQIVEYMQDIRQLHRGAVDNLEDAAKRTPNVSSEIASRDRDTLARFFERAKQVQQWRLNFGYPTPRDRILDAARYVAESVLKTTTFTEASEETISRFQKELYELLQDWGAPQSLSAGA